MKPESVYYSFSETMTNTVSLSIFIVQYAQQINRLCTGIMIGLCCTSPDATLQLAFQDVCDCGKETLTHAIIDVIRLALSAL